MTCSAIIDTWDVQMRHVFASPKNGLSNETKIKIRPFFLRQTEMTVNKNSRNKYAIS